MTTSSTSQLSQQSKLGRMTDDHSAAVDRQGRSTMPLFQAGRTLRSASISSAARLLDFNPAAGVWQATGTAIAHAPNFADLRSSDEVAFDFHARTVRRSNTQPAIDRPISRRATAPAIGPGRWEEEDPVLPLGAQPDRDHYSDLSVGAVSWRDTCKRLPLVTWEFLCTPTGFFITVYGLNVIAWGAMLFFLLLNVGSMTKEQKEVWIEIDSQILNGLFCLTSWGLAPWRIRDTYWLLQWRLCDGSSDSDELTLQTTLTGKVAPPTSEWKMDFVIINMLLNTLFQVGMAAFMWCYNRHNRPSYGVGLFIGLGCFSSLLAGVMSWWEGRKVKRIEGSLVEEIQGSQYQVVNTV
ncbi:hypothetical protein AtubIFM61612_010396 [Aspergillus tubingensis]|nr:hypothetical protein AtubIFM57143_010550 [Aspergillus tubingensis]GLB20460.1 hypothetical protein AtubIFM61612_010396 [Aspergillus tubingensis]